MYGFWIVLLIAFIVFWVALLATVCFAVGTNEANKRAEEIRVQHTWPRQTATVVSSTVDVTRERVVHKIRTKSSGYVDGKYTEMTTETPVIDRVTRYTPIILYRLDTDPVGAIPSQKQIYVGSQDTRESADRIAREYTEGSTWQVRVDPLHPDRFYRTDSLKPIPEQQTFVHAGQSAAVLCAAGFVLLVGAVFAWQCPARVGKCPLSDE